MLENTRHNYRLITIFVSTVGAGLPLWTTNTRHIDFTDSGFLVLWVGIGVVASLIVRFVVNLKMRDMIGCFAIGYVLAIVIHFVGTILISSYVQARFELSLLIALIAGISSGGIGSLLWTGFKKNGNRRR